MLGLKFNGTWRNYQNRSWTTSKNTKQMGMSTWWQRLVQGKQP